MNTQLFIEKATKIHGDKYDYSKVEYINSRTKVIIICKQHGEFEQTPNGHLTGYGCKKCAGHNKTTFEIIDKFIKIHGDHYDYSKVEYINAKTKVIIICKQHGEFLQIPNIHLHGSGCNQCGISSASIKQSKTTSQFVVNAIKIHGDQYDYSQVEYIKSLILVTIICKIHGEFRQIPKHHLHGCGCPKCGKLQQQKKQSKTTAQFIEKAKEIHGDTYDYSTVEYINAKVIVNIICKIHGEFTTTPDSHITHKSGCPKCKYKTEHKLFDYLIVYYPEIIFQPKYEWCINESSKTNKYLPFDFCIEKYKIIIELDGEQHFKQVMNWNPPEVTQQIDKYKMKCANANGYYVIRLLQLDVYNNKNNWNEILLMTIEDIISGYKLQNYFICKNDEYKEF
jgi:hypothetical protein